MLMTDIHVRTFTGTALKPYLHSLAKLRMEVFKEYPFFEEPDLYREMQALRRIASLKESVGVLIFDGITLVGSALGYPLEFEEPAVIKPFEEKHLDIHAYYLFTESLLLKSYRSRGIGHHFFDAREAHVSYNKKYKHICFYIPDIAQNMELKPEDTLPLFDFWRKRGYVPHHEMKFALQWTAIGEAHPSDKQMSFWIKDL
ncbi:MAG: hypothetical protein V4492_07465 [Chlamydiota bacterium]